MYLFVTKKKRSTWLRESLEELVDCRGTLISLDDPYLDDKLDKSATAAETLLQIWFEEEEEE